MSPSDAELLNRWRTLRDAEAFRALAERHVALVYSACRRVTGRAAVAEDIAQECFLTLANTYIPPRRNLPAWLHSVAVNRARDYVKGEVRRRARESEYIGAQPGSAETGWDDVREHVDELIANMPEKWRRVIVAHFLEGRSQEAVAQELGITRQAIKYRIDRGIEHIRKGLWKRGIPITSGALAGLLGTGMAEAAPPSLVAALGTMALSGAPGASTAASVPALFLAAHWAKFAGAGMTGLLALLAFLTQDAIRQSPFPDTRDTASTTPAVQASVDGPNHPAQGVEQADSEDERPANDSTKPVPVDDWRTLTGTVLLPNGEPASDHLFPQEYGVKVSAYLAGRPGFHRAGTSVNRESGLWHLGSFDPGSEGIVYARVPGANLASAFVPFSLTEDGPHDVVLQLTQGARISGEVLQGDGRPIPTSRVQLWNADGESVVHNIDTDDAGTFSIGSIPAGQYELRAEVNGDDLMSSFTAATQQVTVTPGDHRSGVTLRFPGRQTTIAGRVTDVRGRPVEGVTITFFNHLSGSTLGIRQTGSATTGPDGHYELSLYAPATVHMEVQSSKWAWAEGEEGTYKTDAGDTHANFVVERKAVTRLKLRVESAATGEPITRYMVGVGSVNKPENRNWRTYADRTVAADVQWKHESDFAVTVYVRGMGREEMTFSPRSSPIDVTYRIRQEKGISGIVVDHAGRPVPNAVLLPKTNRGSFGGGSRTPRDWFAKTEADGTFSLINPSEGVNKLVAYHPDWPPVAATIEYHSPWKIQLPQGGTVSGRLTMDGKTLAKNRVQVLARVFDDRHVWRSGETNANGVYTIRGIPSGNIRVDANMNDFNGGRQSVLKEVVVENGGRIRVDFDTTSPSAVFRGRVLEGDEPAMAEISILEQQDARRWVGRGKEKTHSDGSFEIDGLHAGQRRVKVQLIGPAPRTKSFQTTLDASDKNDREIRFAPGTAALEGHVGGHENEPGSLELRLQIDTALGAEEVYLRELDLGEFEVEGLPPGVAELSATVTFREPYRAIRRTGVLELQPNTVSLYNVDLRGGFIDLSVPNRTDDEGITVLVFSGEIALPDLDGATWDEVQQFIHAADYELLCQARGPVPIGPLPNGRYTILALGLLEWFPDEEDTMAAGLRSASATVTMEAGQAPPLALTLN